MGRCVKKLVVIPLELHERLRKEEARQRSRTGSVRPNVNGLIRVALIEYLDRKEKKHG